MEYFALPTLGQILALIFTFIFTAAIGIERELRNKDAGIRTHVLVGLGSCLFTLISIYGFTAIPADTSSTVTWDASRIASQIVPGIGFIGAGVIWFHRDAIRGLTTASAIWVAAAIGTACGAQLFLLAGIIVIAYFLLVIVIAPLYYRLAKRSGQIIEITYEERHGVLREVLLEITRHGFEYQVISSRQNRFRDRKDATVSIRVKGGDDTDSLVQWLSEFEGVGEVRLVDEAD